MIISERADPLATATPSASALSSVVPIVVDNTPLSSLAMIIIKIYAFGGLAFIVSVITAAIGYWIWIVIIKREFADSPPELELHPERIRERERARTERLKRQKEAKLEARRRRQQEKFKIPPVQYQTSERGRAYSVPAKPAMRNSSISASAPRPRKSSMSVSPSKGKRVSWASSTSTLDGDGKLSEKPIDEKTSSSDAFLSVPIKSPFESQDNAINPVPRARTSIPRLSASIEERSPRGQQMIAATTPDIAMSWAKPVQNSADPQWHREEAVDPFDMGGQGQHHSDRD